MNKNVVVRIIGVVIPIIGVVIATIAYLFPKPVPDPDFDVSVNPFQDSVQQGDTIQTRVTIKGIANYNYSVNLVANCEPSNPDIIISFDSSSRGEKPDYTSVMTIKVGSGAPASDYLLNVTGKGFEREHSCQYKLTVNPAPPPKEYIVYKDGAISDGDIVVWSGADQGMESPPLINSNYNTSNISDDTKCFAIESGSGDWNYVGWGVFLGTFNNHKLQKPNSVNLSKFQYLEFKVKTPIDLKVEIQQDDTNGKKSFQCLISQYGWDSSRSNDWQRITIPISEFLNVDLNKIFCPFMITGIGSQKAFYVSDVIWVQ